MKFMFTSLKNWTPVILDVLDDIRCLYWQIRVNLGLANRKLEKLMEEWDNLLFTQGYPPLLCRHREENGEWGEWYLSDIYSDFFVNFSWSGEVLESTMVLTLLTNHPQFSQFCDRFSVGYPTSGLFECNEDIRLTLDLFNLKPL